MNAKKSNHFDSDEHSADVSIWSRTLPSDLNRIQAGPWDNQRSVVEHAVLATELASRFDVIETDLPQTVELYSKLNNDQLLDFLSQTERLKKQHVFGVAGSLGSFFAGAVGTGSAAVFTGLTSVSTMGAAVATAAAITAGLYTTVKAVNKLEVIRDKVGTALSLK